MPAPRPGERIGYDMPVGTYPVPNKDLFELWNKSPEFRECNFQQYKSTGQPTAIMVAVHQQFQHRASIRLDRLEKQNKIALQRAIEINKAAQKKGMLCDQKRLILPA